MLFYGLSGRSRFVSSLAPRDGSAPAGPRKVLKGDDMAVEDLLRSLAG